MTPTYDPTPREDEREDEFASRIRMQAIGLGEAGQQDAEKIIEADAEVGRKLAFLSDEREFVVIDSIYPKGSRAGMPPETEQQAFDRGARAMRAHCANIVRAWWDSTPEGRRRPGIPHHLETKVWAAKIEQMEGRP